MFLKNIDVRKESTMYDSLFLTVFIMGILVKITRYFFIISVRGDGRRWEEMSKNGECYTNIL
jgi:hypothetical protein